MAKQNGFFSTRLIAWYLKNKRDLPWRKTKEPYKIWLSEIILQQTRVLQGMPYYISFTSKYPTVHQLAAAKEEEVLKLWQGLGYYSRARNLHFTSKIVANELNGVFPQTYAELKKLKGVGDYTASAIASICFDKPTAVVDGNVYRVLSRVFNVALPINTGKGITYFKGLAQELIDHGQPGTYNQAVMEFGARYCVPQNPDCAHCIFNDKCEAFKKNKVSQLPVKLKTLKTKKRYFNYLVVVSEDGKTLLEQRKGKGIWQNLYQFPLVEASKDISEKQLIGTDGFKGFAETVSVKVITKHNDTPIVHKLSHQHLHTTFWIVETTALGEMGVPVSTVGTYPVPVLVSKFLDGFRLKIE
ncbi:A/G-specific adenine glycosylase [Marinirhabdus gelatinilytica]|uniref:Adenine DNA glycosylase n=1 Tax=Marinirhabdus gelatinilytica TaxID=1703343 RepID=A0A370QKA2_9FLAO|nr:A/G-specific adenine glycosylase [Marinirhabdus gelatinilytica]RDK88795.1 A/G-specific DNA-adenine glycosylase [Marinirhabdus gelatinilytica]